MWRLTLVLVWLGSAAWSQSSCICLKCLTFQYVMHKVVSESMAPALDAGDCPTFRKIDAVQALPQRGHIIAFIHPSTRQAFVFRLIGLPGESVQMVNGVPVVNGNAVEQEALGAVERVVSEQPPYPVCRDGRTPCEVTAARETLPNGVSYTVFDLAQRPTDDTIAFDVPDGHVFVLGDHRDNALDSRFSTTAGGPGFVPLDLVYGVLD